LKPVRRQLIPANKAAGSFAGAIAQPNFFFDDLFLEPLGKPVQSW
jgi:hypothetical protein